MGLSRQEYWSGWLFPSPGMLPDPGMELTSLALADSLLRATREAPCCIYSLLRSQRTRVSILWSSFLLQGCLNKLRLLSQNTNGTLGAWKPQKLLPHSSGAKNSGQSVLWMECLAGAYFLGKRWPSFCCVLTEGARKLSGGFNLTHEETTLMM